MRLKDKWTRVLIIAVLLLAVIAVERLGMPNDRRYKTWHLAGLPEPQKDDRILVFAPHEDDELLGAGCYIRRAIQAGSRVKVVLMTNGEYPEAAMLVAEKTVLPKPQEFVKYGYKRQGETKAALETLGVDPADIVFLGYPDHTMDKLLSASNWLPADSLLSPRTRSRNSPYADSFTQSAPHCGSSVVGDVRRIMAQEMPNVVIAVHPYDIHVDHWGTYAAVKLALSMLKAEGAAFAGSARLYNYMIHRLEWPAPRAFRPGDSLLPPAGFLGLANTNWYALQASGADITLKHSALLGYKTQMGRWNPLLSSFIRMNELFGEVPDINLYGDYGTARTDLPPEASADTAAMLESPAADIKGFSLSVEQGRLGVSINTASKIGGSVSFELEVISYEAFGSGLRVATLKFDSSGIKGEYVEDGTRKNILMHEVSAIIDGSAADIRLPWPMVKGSFIMLWCRTFIDGRSIDQSLVYCLEVD